MKTALVIPIYNRPEYVRRCFASLEKLTAKPDMLVCVDDGSTQQMPDMPDIARQLKKVKQKNAGVKGALLTGITTAIDLGADLIITLDSDAIVKPDFVNRLIELHAATRLITSGFNNPKEPFLPSKLGGWTCLKAHANGINMCFNREQYEKHIKPALLAPKGNWDYMASESAGRVAITTPSCVQHTGMMSSMGHAGADRAHDFKSVQLPDVTLFGIDSHDPSGIQRAASICQEDIQFGAVNIITKDVFTKGGSSEQRRKDYSKFMIRELYDHFDTSHVLTIHADGYVLNADAWCDEWLQYDYIGATWGYKDGMNVGNGGFSLRSKKLCGILAAADLQGEHYHPEDHAIARIYRPALEAQGIRFAPEEVANNFSIEAYGNVWPGGNAYTGQFGFHGPHVDMSSLETHGVPASRAYKKKTVLQSRGNGLPSRR